MSQLNPLALGPFEDWAIQNHLDVFEEWELEASEWLDFDEYADRNTSLIEDFLVEHPEYKL